VDDPARQRPLSASAGIGPGAHLPGGLIPEGLDATLVLVRHGESEFIVEGRFQGQADSPLSEIGLRQAERVAARLANPHASPALPVPAGPPIEIVHSPLSRASETADEIGRAMAGELAFGRPISARPDPGFLEIGQGAWEGLHRSEIESRWGEVLATWRRRPLEGWAPGGESIPEVAARLRPALAEILASLAREGVPGSLDRAQVAGYREPVLRHPWSVVVGHDGLFKVLLLTLFDLPLDRFWMWSFELCGIGVIEFRAGRPVVRAMNLADHLAPLLDEAAQEAAEERERSGAL
jgi:broad specificity phosphatase PhoE